MLNWLNRCVVSRRRIAANPVGSLNCGTEMLESRCLLSVSTSGRSLVSDVAIDTHAERHSRKAPAAVPDISGQYAYFTNIPDGEDIPGVLTLDQKGKKVTGLLQREFQPDGKFKAKLVGSRAEEETWVGKVQDRAAASLWLKFVMSRNADGSQPEFTGTFQKPTPQGAADFYMSQL